MSFTNQTRDDQHLGSIQAMRAVAALMIVIGHALAFFALELPSWLGGGLIHTFAYAGVDIFFVISGIVVCAAANRAAQLSKGQSRLLACRGFLLKRVFRIYPVYLFVLALVLIFAAPLKLNFPDLSASKLIGTALLIDKNNPYIPQAWSLVFELYFYLVLASILLLPHRYFYRSLALWLSTTIGAAIVLAHYAISVEVLFDPLIIEFGLGCLIAYLISINAIKMPLFMLSVGAAFFTWGAYQTLHQGLLPPLPRTLSFGVGSAFLLYGLIGLELHKKIRAPKPLTYLGNISYSIYIWHELLISVVLVIFANNTELYRRLPVLSVALFVALVVAVSAISFSLIEKTGQRWGNKLFPASQPDHR